MYYTIYIDQNRKGIILVTEDDKFPAHQKLLKRLGYKKNELSKCETFTTMQMAQEWAKFLFLDVKVEYEFHILGLPPSESAI